MSAIICLYSLFFIAISVQADWRFNPFTQKLDYYQQDTAGAGAFATSSSYGVNLVYPNGVADVLIIGGTATTSNDVIFDVTGDSEFDTANFSGAVTLGSTLNVTGKTTLSYGTSTAFTADNFYGTLTGTASGNLESADIDTLVELNAILLGETLASTTTIREPEYTALNTISGATYDDLQDYINKTMSSGNVSEVDITDNGDGTVAVDGGQGYIRADSVSTSTLYSFDWSASSSMDTTDDALNYVYVDYNSGSPKLEYTTTLSGLDHTSQFVVGLVYQEAAEAHIAEAGQQLNNVIHNLYYYLWEHNGIERASGAVTSEDGSEDLTLNISAGVFYWALERITTAAFDSSTDGSADTFEYFYRDGGGDFTASTSSWALETDEYDDGDGTPGAVTVNKYGTHWVYMTIDGDVYVQLGQGNYTLSEALAAERPATMDELTNIGIFIARIITQNGDANFIEVSTPWGTDLTIEAATDHGDMAGLTDDDHTQYGALAQDETVTGTWTFGNASTTNLTATNIWTTDLDATNLTVTYASTTGITATNIWATTFTGDLVGDVTGDVTGNADTATALAANGANCNAGEYPLGVDASGAVESCTDATTEINSEIGNVLDGTYTFTDFTGNDIIDTDNLNWGNFTDLAEGGAVSWGNVGAGELGNDSVINEDIDDDGDFTFTGDWTFTNASTTIGSATGRLFADEIEDITGTTTIQDAVEFTDGTYGCYFVFGATTTLKCY